MPEIAQLLTSIQAASLDFPALSSGPSWAELRVEWVHCPGQHRHRQHRKGGCGRGRRGCCDRCSTVGRSARAGFDRRRRRARWVTVPPSVFEAVCGLLPRDDRSPDRRIFQGFGGDKFRTTLTRACTASGIPTLSPHDLRHRRISLLHLAGIPWARIGEHVGQRDLAVTANTYSHVLADEAELDYAGLLGRV